jgi:hypothetical protein
LIAYTTTKKTTNSKCDMSEGPKNELLKYLAKIQPGQTEEVDLLRFGYRNRGDFQEDMKTLNNEYKIECLRHGTLFWMVTRLN